jgi:hypothetical protein
MGTSMLPLPSWAAGPPLNDRAQKGSASSKAWKFLFRLFFLSLSLSLSFSPSPPKSLVNRCICRFGPYKKRRRPHPSRRATWVFQHPTRVTLLTYLTRPSPFLPSPCIDVLTHLTRFARLDQSASHLPVGPFSTRARNGLSGDSAIFWAWRLKEGSYSVPSSSLHSSETFSFSLEILCLAVASSPFPFSRLHLILFSTFACCSFYRRLPSPLSSISA